MRLRCATNNHTRRGGFQTHPVPALERRTWSLIWPHRYNLVSKRIGMRMLTSLPIGEAEGGFETRHYELNRRRDKTNWCKT